MLIYHALRVSHKCACRHLHTHTYTLERTAICCCALFIWFASEKKNTDALNPEKHENLFTVFERIFAPLQNSYKRKKHEILLEMNIFLLCIRCVVFGRERRRYAAQNLSWANIFHGSSVESFIYWCVYKLEFQFVGTHLHVDCVIIAATPL